MPYLDRSRRPAYLPRDNRKREPTSDRDLYNSARWKKVRQTQIETCPVCEVHQAAGELVDCTQRSPIDHIVPVSQGGAETDRRNLMTLCPSCHDRKSAMERRRGCLVSTMGEPGRMIPADGEKERLIEQLKFLLCG